MADNGNEGMESRVASFTIDRPEAGETLTVAVTPGLRVVLAFNPAAAKFAVAGDDFVLTLDDGGQVVFQGLVTAAQGADAPTIQIAGIDIDAGVLMEQVLALAEQAEAEPIETAAGEAGAGAEAGGGSSRYDDSFGDVISGLAKQGVIGETELGFGLIADGNIELPIDTAFLSGGAASPGGGSGGRGGGGDGLESLAVNDMNIITNQASGNLQIPDELILYLADPDMELGVYLADPDADLSVSGPSYDGVADNAHIWAVPGVALAGADSFNTWADDGDGHVRFHIGGTGPLYRGSFSYQVADGEGGKGAGTIGVENVETGKAGSYWTLDGTDADEILLGLDGRNQIDGGGGDDIIHGGHDSSGDILMGGDGDDVIFGGSGKDDLQGGDGDDTFIMRAGFGRDDVDGGDGIDTITLDSVLTGADVTEAGIDSWLTADQAFTHDIDANTIIFDGTASGTIDLGGGNEITFLNVEEIDYAIFA